MITAGRTLSISLLSLLLLTGCSDPTSDDSVEGVEVSRFGVIGVTEISGIDAETFSSFFNERASTLDTLEYTARYVLDGATVSVDRTPERLVAEVSHSPVASPAVGSSAAPSEAANGPRSVPVNAVIRLSADAALVCTTSCVSLSTWLADPTGVTPPQLDGVSVARWWDLFVETGAHDPNTVAFIPTLALTDTKRVFYQGTRQLAGIGTTECVGYLSADNDAIAWCFTSEGVWASGPSQVALLTELTLR
jgi:hypothetical protein